MAKEVDDVPTVLVLLAPVLEHLDLHMDSCNEHFLDLGELGKVGRN